MKRHLPFLAFIGLAVLWSAYWAYALSEARARVADWRAERAAAGRGRNLPDHSALKTEGNFRR